MLGLIVLGIGIGLFIGQEMRAMQPAQFVGATAIGFIAIGGLLAIQAYMPELLS